MRLPALTPQITQDSYRIEGAFYSQPQTLRLKSSSPENFASLHAYYLLKFLTSLIGRGTAHPNKGIYFYIRYYQFVDQGKSAHRDQDKQSGLCYFIAISLALGFLAAMYMRPGM